MGEKIMLLPFYNQPSRYAILLNRYAWGMNLHVGFIDVDKCIIYIGESIGNFYYPEGLAVKKIMNDSEAAIYLNNDCTTRKYLYSNGKIDNIPTDISDFLCR